MFVLYNLKSILHCLGFRFLGMTYHAPTYCALDKFKFCAMFSWDRKSILPMLERVRKCEWNGEYGPADLFQPFLMAIVLL